jgi:diaminopimelate epimerase
MNNFVKSHGLGNDYIVLDIEKINFKLTPKLIKKICHRNYGIGSDGILLLIKSRKADFGLKIFNPDGTEAEKSGNGLRIFSKFLFDYKYTKKKSFSIETKGGVVKSEVKTKNNKVELVKVEMGTAIFEPKEIPVSIKKEVVLKEKLKIKNKVLTFSSVSIGNPHCVIFTNSLSAKTTIELGEIIEKHKIFPSRTNVQFAKILSKKEVMIEIWERGAGYTLASGSSSCGVVAVGFKLGLLGEKVRVIMPGGILNIEIDNNYNIIMQGPVEEICSGELSFK